MSSKDFISSIHNSTKRDYLARVNDYPKAEAATIAKRFDYDYWDGDRKVGYGGFYYDGRWLEVAKKIAQNYGLKAGDRVLDVGCGKGFLLYDLTQAVPGLSVTGIDISQYAIDNSHPEIRDKLLACDAKSLPFEDKIFDLIISINTLHNLYCPDLHNALREIERVSKSDKYICVESYRNEQEKVNLLYWQLTCEVFCTPAEWLWWFGITGYTGDHSFIFFE